MRKKNNSILKRKSKYHKWGFTAFAVIMASVLSIYAIINFSVFTGAFSSFIGLLMPIIDGLIVAYLLSPLVDKIEEKILIPLCKKMNIDSSKQRPKTIIRVLSIILCFGIIVLLLFLFFKSVVPQLIDSVKNIIDMMPVYLDSLIEIANKILGNFDAFKGKDIVSIANHYYNDIMEFVNKNIVPSLNEMARNLSSSVFGFVGALFDLLVGFCISVYLLLSKEHFKGQFKKLIYSIFETERANKILSDLRFVDKTFVSFIVGKIIDSMIMGLLCFIVLTLFNMPYTILISVIVGVTNVITFFGPIIGAIPSFLLILIIDPIKAIYFLIIILVLQQIDGNILGPWILGNSTGVSGVWVIFAITFFGGLWGVPGMFLGIPIWGCIYAWIKRQMRRSLEKKKLSIQTADYVNLDYIDKNKELIMKESSEPVDKIKYTTLYDSNKKKETIPDIIQEKLQEEISTRKEKFNTVVLKKEDTNYINLDSSSFEKPLNDDDFEE